MNKFLCSAAFAISSISAIATSAHAEDFYVGAKISPSMDGHIQYTRNGATVERDAKDKQTLAGLFAGYDLSPNWALEGGYRGFGGSTSFDLGDSHLLKLRTSVGYLALKGTWMLSEDWALFGKAGVARSSLTGGATGAGAPPEETWRKTGAYLSVGASYMVAKDVSLQLELEHSDKLEREGLKVNMDKFSLGLRVGF